jgi:large subunit ribosomal protein L3
MTTQVQARLQGLLGEKLGMTQVWDDNNRIVPVTVVKAGPCVVTQIRTPQTDGYDAVQIAFGAPNPRKVTKPMRGHFDKAGVTPRRHTAELRTSAASEYTLGQELTVEIFEPGQVVDVVGTSKGKGFAGVMKRHGFSGVGASLDAQPGLQGHADGRSDGERPGHGAEPHDPLGGRREGSAPPQGCGAGSRRWAGTGQDRREGGLRT